VTEGQGSMNEAYLTGEPFEVAKTPGALVLSGALNGEALLTIRAEKLPTDSRYARIMRKKRSNAALACDDWETRSAPGTRRWRLASRPSRGC